MLVKLKVYCPGGSLFLLISDLFPIIIYFNHFSLFVKYHNFN